MNINTFRLYVNTLLKLFWEYSEPGRVAGHPGTRRLRWGDLARVAPQKALGKRGKSI
jgi:hypothetical protein